MKALASCANGDGRPVQPPSKVICRECPGVPKQLPPRGIPLRSFGGPLRCRVCWPKTLAMVEAAKAGR